MVKRIRSITPFCVGLLLINSSSLLAQGSGNKHYFTDSIVSFFAGDWKGEGRFANGKSIAASLHFQLALDSCWLISTHTDAAPNNYKAQAFWGMDAAAGTLVAYTFDNFHGHRRFSGQWADSLVFTNTSATQQGAAYYQRFVYKKLDAQSFRYAYLVSGDSLTWREGDYLIFRRS